MFHLLCTIKLCSSTYSKWTSVLPEPLWKLLVASIALSNHSQVHILSTPGTVCPPLLDQFFYMGKKKLLDINIPYKLLSTFWGRKLSSHDKKRARKHFLQDKSSHVWDLHKIWRYKVIFTTNPMEAIIVEKLVKH